MRTMNITATEETFPELWCVIWRGILVLTEQESNLLSEIVREYLVLRGEGLIEPYLSSEVLTTSKRTLYQERLGITTSNLRNLLSSLKSKGALVDRVPGKIALHHNLIPDKELVFRFINND